METQKEEIKIANQIEAIQHFIKNMDIEMIDAFLDNDLTYQDFKKNIFINKLSKSFEVFKIDGDTTLSSYIGACNVCDKTKTGYTFIGNKTHNYMSIIFDTADGKIKDLYECSDYKNKKNGLILNKRIFINDDLELNDNEPF